MHKGIWSECVMVKGNERRDRQSTKVSPETSLLTGPERAQ